MRKHLLALVLVLVGGISSAQGQTPEAPPDARSIEGSAGSAEFAATGVPESRSFGSFLPFRSATDAVPDNAEAAEDLAAAERKTNRFWVRAEFMAWWIKAANLPPLLTTGSSADAIPGALGSGNTGVLFGGSGTDYHDRSGARFTAGWWFDDEEKIGLEASYFFLAGRSIGQNFSSPGNPPLAVPFFNVISGQPDSFLLAYPGVMSGRATVDLPTFLQSAEANLTTTLLQTPHVRVEALAGFRYVDLNEGLHLAYASQVSLAPQYQNLGIPYDGNTITAMDLFDTRNQFYGGQLGARTELRHKRWILDLAGKVALGDSHETVSIRGSTSIDTQPVTVVNSGLLALGSNSGQYAKNAFAVVPEIGFTLKFQLTDRIRIFGGYSFLYWSNVARPGDQVNTNINPNLVPPPNGMTFGAGGAAQPAFVFHSTSFYAQGANFGLEFRY